MAPTLSVIIASYNHEEYIAETLKSLEGQSFQDFEIIMVDDGSTDNTVKVARETPSRTQIFTQENHGVVAARNRAVNMAKGRYICFVDSDDFVLPDRFERQVKLLDRNNSLGLVFSDALIVNVHGKQIGKFSDVYPVIPGDTAEMLVMHYCFTPMITVMVRTNVLKKTGPFEGSGPISDYIKWIEVSHLSKVHYIPKPLGCQRIHQRNTSKNFNQEEKYFQTRVALQKILRKYPKLKAKIGKNISKRFSRTYFLTGFWLASDGNVKRARKYYRKALRIYPWLLENWCGLLFITVMPRCITIKIHNWIKSKKLPW